MLIFGANSRICDDTYCCSEQYIYDISLYLLSILDHEYNIIIEHVLFNPETYAKSWLTKDSNKKERTLVNKKNGDTWLDVQTDVSTEGEKNSQQLKWWYGITTIHLLLI